ncbi:50S ribosome-binding GTPase [Alkalihalobacillus oceani]|uniref:50S ribosome-binding GTPase n=1 Tax=Halalkalibacter oceani TaxID=1653776 RepID=A0A9X2DQB0_9BACI|nr:50S ribosome-binding GTPase [Halalkalibacter oceani]
MNAKELTVAKERIVLVGLESVGKTSVFACLTNQRAGRELNAKGSTIFVKERHSGSAVFVDTPGLRRKDSEAFCAARIELERAAHLLFVVRGTHFSEEIRQLASLIPKNGVEATVLVTFADKMEPAFLTALQAHARAGDWPLIMVDARRHDERSRSTIINQLKKTKRITQTMWEEMAQVRHKEVDPKPLWFDHPVCGIPLALIMMFLLFALPVMLAYRLSSVLEPLLYRIIEPLELWTANFPDLFQAVLTGSYGLFTLGIYSFVWAFPVVLFISIASAVADDSGLKDRIVDTLDPLMSKIGLNGQDLVPFISGFGCNVVAVQQTRSCILTTRTSCVSLISFGSACSYQIGATLSVFHVAGLPWLFLPYMLTLTFVAAIHNRLWYPIKEKKWLRYFQARKTFLQWPSTARVAFRVKGVFLQFLTQAMPIFFFICLIASLFEYVGILAILTRAAAPLVQLIGAPAEAAAGIVFSMIRKDGILLFNEGGGTFMSALAPGTVFLLVYIASTLSSCLVTIWTIAKELRWKAASALYIKQLITSVVSAVVLLAIIRFFE